MKIIVILNRGAGRHQDETQSANYELLSEAGHRCASVCGEAWQRNSAICREVLTESGLNDDNIRTEEFTGY